MATDIINNSLKVVGNIAWTGTHTPILRTGIAQTALAAYAIPWTAWRVWDAYNTNLPGTPATDDLGLVGGTFATSSPSIQTEDVKALGAVNKYARCVVGLPPEYEDGETVQLRFHAGMLTTIADTTATLIAAIYKSDNEAGIGSNLYAGSALDVNNLTLADYDFTATPTTLTAGDLLDIRINFAVNDGASATVVKGIIGAAYLLCDIRG